MNCMDDGFDHQYDEIIRCPNCREVIGYMCVNCGETYDGGIVNNYGECSCVRAKAEQKCSFDGCGELVCEADKESPDRMHFCQKHHDQLAQYVKDNAIPKIIGFWVKANGGAKKLAKTF